MNANPYLPVRAKILEVVRQTEQIATFQIESPGLNPVPGQFLEVSIPKVGECPLSISDFDSDYIELTVRKVGKVTGALNALRKGDHLFIREPYGNGFPLEKLAGRHVPVIQEIAERYGNGTVHLSARQALTIPGIPAEKIPEVRRLMASYIQGVEVAAGVNITDVESGFPTPLPPNIIACIGSRDCALGNVDTAELAQKLERTFYPGGLMLKMGVAGCANDCVKVHMQDVGIIGMVEPLYDPARCLSCESCVKNCP